VIVTVMDPAKKDLKRFEYPRLRPKTPEGSIYFPEQMSAGQVPGVLLSPTAATGSGEYIRIRRGRFIECQQRSADRGGRGCPLDNDPIAGAGGILRYGELYQPK